MDAQGAVPLKLYLIGGIVLFAFGLVCFYSVLSDLYLLIRAVECYTHSMLKLNVIVGIVFIVVFIGLGVVLIAYVVKTVLCIRARYETVEALRSMGSRVQVDVVRVYEYVRGFIGEDATLRLVVVYNGVEFVSDALAPDVVLRCMDAWKNGAKVYADMLVFDIETPTDTWIDPGSLWFGTSVESI
jgi:hypothetical protein